MTSETIKKYAYTFSTTCAFVVLLGFIPSFTIGRGYLFGIYKTDMWDDILHIVSAFLATAAVFYSTKATVVFFRVVGILYTIDSIFGFFFENGFLDLSIFLHETIPFGLVMRLAANAPHFALGLFALYVGFILKEQPASSDIG